jgi:radical SAM enzyme (rSAM/lipoprotein system)
MINSTKIPLKKKILLNLYAIKKSSEAVVHELNYLFWECTIRCNMSCLHCGSDCSRDTTTPDMPLPHFLNVLDTIAISATPSKIVIAITGGEPLIRADLAEAGLEITKRGFPWGMVTNGYLLTREKMNDLLDAGIGSMAISLDGLEADHNWFRGNEQSFKRAIAAIGHAAGSNKNEFIFDIVTCVNKRNFKDLEKIKSILIDNGVKKWRLVSIFPKGRAQDNPELKLTGEQLRQTLDFIKLTRDEGKIIASYGCEGFLGGYEMETRDFPFYCRAGIGIGSVLVDGSISACPSLRADYIQGSIYKDNFMDIWNNRFQVMRNRNWLKTGECTKCKVWKYCKGNGLHLRKENTGELLYCNYKALSEERNA